MAEAYGDFLTSPLGHYAHWNNLQRLPAATLQRWLNTTAPLHYEYEDWPRGRIVHHQPTARFIIYADAQLDRPAFVDQIRRTFDLLDQPCEVRLDAHYSRTLRLPGPPPEPP